MTFEERFWSRVAIGTANDCWPWTGGFYPDRYGRFFIGKRAHRAHRVAFFLTHGSWPEPCCLHRCDNRPCCNPKHLYEGTYADNNADRDRKGRKWNSKLSVTDVATIRRRAAQGERQSTLATAYGVGQSHISQIVSGRKWKGVSTS